MPLSRQYHINISENVNINVDLPREGTDGMQEA